MLWMFEILVVVGFEFVMIDIKEGDMVVLDGINGDVLVVLMDVEVVDY